MHTRMPMNYYKSITDIWFMCTFHMQNSSSKHFHFITCNLCEIWGSQMRAYKDYILLGYDTVYCDTSLCTSENLLLHVLQHIPLKDSSKHMCVHLKKCILSYFVYLTILDVYLLHIQIYHCKVNHTSNITVRTVNVLTHTWTASPKYKTEALPLEQTCFVAWYYGGGGSGHGDSGSNSLLGEEFVT